jgi:hypothetical protein
MKKSCLFIQCTIIENPIQSNNSIHTNENTGLSLKQDLRKCGQKLSQCTVQ